MTTTTTSGAGIVEKVHSRQKRYLAFPDGSSVSAAICLTVGMLGNPNVNFISWAVNWGVAYNLPNHNWVIQHAHGFAANLTKPMIQRRSRRSFYNELQTAIDHMGFNGRDCVARALCESAKYLQTPGRRGNMLEQLVRTVFSLPTAPVAAHEPASHHEYDSIYRRSKRELRDCHELYAGCQFSLLALGLGHYAAAPAQFNKHHFM
ncbi:CG13616 [Drosophila busckii]|uniref:CG13616 n=2 Tax=Drosophila busckii TaxID=30019 RepID=A0A0M3QYA9_DROBS|nr:CG13616 [Drosophila busckii]